MAFRVRRRWAASLVGSLAAVTAAVVLPSTTLAAYTASTGTGRTTFSTGTFPSYSDAIAYAAPLGYYKLDDATGSTTAADSTGHNDTAQLAHTAQFFQTPGSPAASSDTAVTFPGTNLAYLTSKDQFTAGADTSATFELWFKTSTAGGVLAEISDKSSGAGNSQGRLLEMLPTGKVQFTVGSAQLATTTNYADGAWHHIVASVGAQGMKLFLDGTLTNGLSSVTTAGMTTGWARFGGDKTSWFTGSLDEAAVYPSQLGDARVAAHYAARGNSYTTAVTADSPWGFWHLSDAPVGPWGQDDLDYPVTMADASGSGHLAQVRGLTPVIGSFRQPSAIGGNPPGYSMGLDGGGWGYSTTLRSVPATFTYEMWFKTTTTTGGVLAVFTSTGGVSCHVNTAARCGRMLFMRNDGFVQFGIQPAKDLYAVTSSRALNDGQWHYVVATTIVPTGSTSAELRLYVDNVQDATAGVAKPNDFSGYFAFGGGGLPLTTTSIWPASASFTGWLDNVAYYDRTLTSSEMSTHWFSRSRGE